VLVLPETVRTEIRSQAERGAPAEVCGVLAGAHGGDRSRVVVAHPTDNVADAPRTRYRIDPEALFALIERIEDEGREVVGFYHSHPAGPERPSETDAARATWTGYSYVICSLAGSPSLGSWRWTGEGFEREELLVGD